jgi:hypothetical protein
MPKYNFVTVDGSIPSGIRQKILDAVNLLKGKKCTIEVLEAKEKRGTQANRYYWGVLVCAARQYLLEKGQPKSIDDVHEELLIAFAPVFLEECIDGIERLKLLRSSKMNKEQFYNYCTAIEAWLVGEGVVLPANEEGLEYDARRTV